MKKIHYDIFGKPLSGGWLDAGYLGKPYNADTGLYNYGLRDYSPATARFTTPDPIRDGFNWYAYCNNDPVNWVDVCGLNAGDGGGEGTPHTNEDSKPIELYNKNIKLKTTFGRLLTKSTRENIGVSYSIESPTIGTVYRYPFPSSLFNDDGYMHKKGNIMKIAEIMRGTTVMYDIESYHDMIESAAMKNNIPPNLIRAIIYEEQTHNKTPSFEWLKYINSVGPMAINKVHWDMNTRKDMINPARNIELGAELLLKAYTDVKKYNDRITVAQIASYYNTSANITDISNYGKRVEYFYAWFEKNYKN